MARARFNYPDLDVLDSPLVSPTPLTSVGGIPGSAVAENIFNDPDSWRENDTDDIGIPEDLAHDPLVRFLDDIEMFTANSVVTPPTGGSSAFSPSSTTTSSSTIYTPLQINTASVVVSSTEDGYSPIVIYSASATLSFLEWYGIYPDSPRLDLNRRTMMQQRRKSGKPNISALKFPSPRHAIRPSSLVSASPSRDAFARPPEKRVSSVPPRESESLVRSPPRRPPSQPPAPASSQPLKISNRPVGGLPSASPPLYTRTESPVGSRPKSNSSSHSSSTSRSQSRTGTPAQGDPKGTARRRRLPSVPPEPGPSPILLHAPAPVPSRQPSPSLQSPSIAPPSLSISTYVSPALISQPHLSTSRPLSTRSLLVGPAGPRTRTSHNWISSQDTVTRSRPFA